MRIDPSDLPLTGGCQCGACRFEATAAPRLLYVCHCTECRAQSASAFGISVIFDADAVRMTRGAPRGWRRAAGSGGTLDCRFCPDCGTRLFHRGGDSALSVKGGALDRPPVLTGAAQIWTRSRIAPLDLGGPEYETEPPDRRESPAPIAFGPDRRGWT